MTGASGASLAKEAHAGGVFRSDIDMTAGSFGFDVALAPNTTASFALHVDATGYVVYAGCASEPPPPAVPLPGAGGLAALGWACWDG